MNDEHLGVEIKGNAQDIEPSPDRFNLFIGFIYATTIGLVLRTAYFGSQFVCLVQILIPLGLLVFFAFDWNSRSAPRYGMPGTKEESNKEKNLRRFLEIVIVYFLLIACLKVVEVYVCKIPPKGDELADIHSVLLYSACVFAFASAVWNWVVINISEQVNKDHIGNILLFHLPEAIVTLFPKVRAWTDYQAKLKLYVHQHAARSMRTASRAMEDGSSKSEHMEEALNEIGVLWSKLNWPSRFWFVCKRLFHVLLIYFFAYHIVGLNVVLGFLIGLSALLMQWGEPLWILHSTWIIIAILGGTIISLIFFVLYFMSTRKKRYCERIAYICLISTFVFCYLIVPPWLLLILLLLQQIGANIIMNLWFAPTAQNKTKDPDPADPDIKGCQIEEEPA